MRRLDRNEESAAGTTTQAPQRVACDALVVGAGFYGAVIASALAAIGRSVTVVDRENGLLRRASLRNQARVHGGYHYPRSLRTGGRSQANYARFVADQGDAVNEDIRSIYAIARIGSHVRAGQFVRFCERIGAPVAPAGPAESKLFEPLTVEAAFDVREATFDAERLAARLGATLEQAGVTVHLDTEVDRIEAVAQGLDVSAASVDGRRTVFNARDVVVCAYAGTNTLAEQSGIAPLPLRSQDTEMALIELPETLRSVAITVMDGPFFSVVPYPPRPGLHSLSHVRFTPRMQHQKLAKMSDAKGLEGSAFPYMIADARRFVPMVAEARFVDTIRETKVFPIMMGELNDDRPILVHRPPGFDGLAFIVGGKIDNVYDVAEDIVAQARGRASRS